MCFVQAKEEPAQRAGDTEQSTEANHSGTSKLPTTYQPRMMCSGR